MRDVRTRILVAVTVAGVVGAVATGVPVSIPAGAVAGSSWTVVTTPNTSLPDQHLNAIACVTSSDCWAVGSSDADGSVLEPSLAERWDGTAWTIVPTANTSAPKNRLLGVACVTASDCWAVGFSATSTLSTLAEHWNGSAWSIVATPGTGASSAVTCVSSTNCWSVGFATQHWNGVTWSLSPMPTVAGSSSPLIGVTCTSVSDCWAVGQLVNGNMGRNLGEHWDGISWSVMTPPDVPGRNDGLWAVSCLSASDCWTVGGSNDFVTQHTLAEHWNGRAWRIVPTPHFASENDGFQGLTCLSTSDCWAVGSGTQRSAVAEHWNGGAWSVSPTPAPNASEQNQLTAVDCTSTSDCWAVGAAVAANTPRSPSRTLAEHDTLAPSPLLIPGGGSVVEGNSGSAVLKVPVTLSNAFPQTVTVEWTTYPIAGVGRADSGIDYAPASGTVTFAPGQTTKEVAVAVLGDTLVEPDEWLAVSFTHATNATIGGFYGLGFGEIVNDDGP